MTHRPTSQDDDGEQLDEEIMMHRDVDERCREDRPESSRGCRPSSPRPGSSKRTRFLKDVETWKREQGRSGPRPCIGLPEPLLCFVIRL